MAQPKATIFGCTSTKLTYEEKQFFSRVNPLGFILFTRNCQNPNQVVELVDELRTTTGRDDTPILIDQEGGRVQRLNPPYWRAAPAASTFSLIAEDDLELACDAVEDNYWLIGAELRALGITANCAPNADLLFEKADKIIGDRSFGSDPDVVAQLALYSILGMIEQGICPIIKHLPGHGRAPVDSHKSLPIVTANKENLSSMDFYAFRKTMQLLQEIPNLPTPWGMTAHVVYCDIDGDEPATHSSTLINNIIRGEIGFDGFLITDCLTMQALDGSYEQRTVKALNAGCDAVLHCNGDLEQMIEIAASAGEIRTEGANRLSSSLFSASLNFAKSEEEVLSNLNKTLDKYSMLVEQEEHELQKIHRE